MNAKIAKTIKRYAKLRKLDYSRCKTVYLNASPDERALYHSEMVTALEEPVRPVIHNDKLPNLQTEKH